MKHRLVFSSALLLCIASASGTAQVRTPQVQTPARISVATAARIIASVQLDEPPGTRPGAPRTSTVHYTGGEWVGGTLTLINPAVADGMTILMRSSDINIAYLPDVSLNKGESSVRFRIRTLPVLQDHNITITASVGGDTATAGLLVMAPRLVYFMIDKNTAVGGDSLMGRLRFSGPPPNASYARIALASDNGSAVSLQSWITLPVGVMDTTFRIRTRPVARDTLAKLTASWSGQSFQRDLTVRAASLKVLICQNPCSSFAMPVGYSAYVGLDGPAGPGGFTVALKSSDPARVPVPGSVTIAHLQQGTHFNLAVPLGPASFSATISATLGSTKLDAPITFVLPDLLAQSIRLYDQNGQSIQSPPALNPFRACAWVSAAASPIATGPLALSVGFSYTSSAGTGRSGTIALVIQSPYTSGQACLGLPGLDQGQYHDIEFVIDPTNAIPERQENNNTIKARLKR